MTTQFNETLHSSQRLGRPGKILIGIFAVLIIALGVWTGVGIASAAPPVNIGVGTAISQKIAGTELNDGGCNVAAVDKSARKVITAGHCGSPQAKLYSGGVFVGVIIESHQPSKDNPVSASVRDYAVIQLAPNVIVRGSPVRLTGVVKPYVGMPVYKYGHGIANRTVREGVVTRVTAVGVETDIISTPFDSGSAIIAKGSNQWIAVISGMTDPLKAATGVLGLSDKGSTVGTRADKIVEWTGVQIDYDLAG